METVLKANRKDGLVVAPKSLMFIFAAAAARLVERLGGTVVKMIFPIELEGFQARVNALKGYDVVSLVKYPGK